MTPPTAPERCPTCDRDGCPKLLPAEHTEECRSDCPRCAAIDDCHAHRVDWRARAIAAEAELAGASAAICDVSDTIRRALDGDEGGMRAPYHGPLAVVLRYPSIVADLRRLDEVLTIGSPRAAAMRDNAAQWAKVAPLIERLREAMAAWDAADSVSMGRARLGMYDAAAKLLAATEATP